MSDATTAPNALTATELLNVTGGPAPAAVLEGSAGFAAATAATSAVEGPDAFAVQIADQIESFIIAVAEIAKGDDPDSAVPHLLLQISQLLLAGGRLGAHEDVVPEERYEPDTGPEPDMDGLRDGLARLLEPVDVYSEVFDPYVPRAMPVACRISDDLADVVTDLRHGMAHYRAGRVGEALWWWQFSYLSNWGPTAGAALRAVQSLVAHVRLDTPLAELDGLDTDTEVEDGDLERQAGRVMAVEIAAPLGLRPDPA
ncbi:DUF5063 domain-containing protein [Streptomyces spiramenti]|uniref:DUF5063 domain-containing protein n=1 Tax=Streptomyces spiramenti TaxID=2720606 RepID=A0ABX1AUW8_9ACTN|nr:DUF5063 domain-containing protein [Streptomyces spiramenti]NJP68613.1 DUF5063 domain-containing protein [Streptomyces spiramenti]